jgi:hypothetical protein
VALWECAECTTKYAVGLPKCPHCESVVRVNENTQPEEEDSEMAKVTVHGGASNAAADEQEGGEDVSAGTSSSTSSEKESSSPEPSEAPRPSRARGTANRSKPGRKAAESSTAEATATSGPETDAADES